MNQRSSRRNRGFLGVVRSELPVRVVWFDLSQPVHFPCVSIDGHSGMLRSMRYCSSVLVHVNNLNTRMDFESGFWQVELPKTSRDKTTFFVPGAGQERWIVMYMGCLNAHAMFCCILDIVKQEWNAKARTDKGIRNYIEVTLKGQLPWTDADVVIVDNVMLHSIDEQSLLKYFEIVLETLQHYRASHSQT
jgi:hypothetical protein